MCPNAIMYSEFKQKSIILFLLKYCYVCRWGYKIMTQAKNNRFYQPRRTFNKMLTPSFMRHLSKSLVDQQVTAL